MTRIGIHGKDFQNKSSRFLEKVLDHLKKKQVEIWVSSKFLKQFKSSRIQDYQLRAFDQGDHLHQLDCFLSLGGDGTLLESVTYIGKAETPILGINTGRLGFLATISREDVEKSLDELLNNNFTIDSRSLLRLVSTPKLFGNLNFALNDFTIMKKDTSSMITVHVHVDGELLNSYWSDGIIVSTPTGSTGYSLSCGGPLVHPKSESFVITAVSPHNLGTRPIVLADDAELSFHIEGRSKKYLISLDSRFETVDESVKLKIKKEKFRVKLIRLSSQNYFNTLRQKLNWGVDIRN
ncbi:MAG: NAD kinase [Cytophagales bacterium]|jgi:NAD+ kinase|nr:NAD kinase [Cytophagales bacterium]MCA6369408.1 NAD kinase [Cytophagales bacterium]MCA6373785.1 NAD kinase [Cytophagales bacterium]MCA6377070.1 NAD kinase [Cytophagales bacterium]MCA6383150.1 NAD kinase [Cytophagales bacterium]